MKKILEGLGKPLTKEDVELRVGSNSAKSFTLLLYKTARTDMKRLNECCPRWNNRHYLDNNNNVVGELSIWDEGLKDWITRQDVGTESQTEKEKGSYSDSFKRAGFRFGIGIELYQAPNMRINWNMKESDYKGKKTYKPIDFWSNNLELSKYEVVEGKPVVEIKYDGRVVFPSGRSPQQAQQTPPESQKTGKGTTRKNYASKNQLKYIVNLMEKKEVDDATLIKELGLKIKEVKYIEYDDAGKAIKFLNEYVPKDKHGGYNGNPQDKEFNGIPEADIPI